MAGLFHMYVMTTVRTSGIPTSLFRRYSRRLRAGWHNASANNTQTCVADPTILIVGLAVNLWLRQSSR